MRNISLRTVLSILLGAAVFTLYAQQDLSHLTWKKVATGMPTEWYATDQAVKVAENVLSHQTEIGGWTKNTLFHKDINEHEWAKVRKTGVGATFDNGATVMEMRFLAKMYRNRKDERYKEAFVKGFNYILKAQYENGGWPQFYPIRPGNSVLYSGHITFNDNAYVNVMNMLRDIFTESDDIKYLNLEKDIKTQASEAFDRGVQCILDTQIIVDGERTVWCAQHDHVTLKPAKARAYELPSFSGAESVNITLLLMSLPDPSDDVVAAVNGAVKWFETHKISDMRYERFRDESGERDSKLVFSPGENVWARFYDLETGKPYFCDRDGIKRETLEEVGKERRGGYSWYNSSPSRVLEDYPDWLYKNNLD